MRRWGDGGKGERGGWGGDGAGREERREGREGDLNPFPLPVLLSLRPVISMVSQSTNGTMLL